MKLWREPFKFHLTVVGAITEALGAFCVSFYVLLKAVGFVKEKETHGGITCKQLFPWTYFFLPSLKHYARPSEL